jgi:hypothetical protein
VYKGDGKGKRFDRAYLHIGMGKTGSTAMQQVYWANAALLDTRHAIHYPVQPVVDCAAGQRGNHSEQILSMFHPRPETIRSNILSGGNSAAQARKFSEELRTVFERGFEDTDARDLLLSAEGIPTLANEAVSALAKWLKQWCEEIHIVACLRHPADAVSSHIQQRLWVGATLAEMYLDPPLYRYSTILPRLERLFGAGRIHIYDFAEAVEDPAGLANRLLREFGLNITLLKVRAKTSNSSMSQQTALLLDSLNRNYPALLGGCRNPEHSGAALRLAGLVPGARYQAPSHVYEILEPWARPHLEWLATHYKVNLRNRRKRLAESREYDQTVIDRRARKLLRLGRTLRLLGRPFSSLSRGATSRGWD